MSWIRTNGTVFEDDWRLVDFIKGVTENFAFIKLPQDGKPNFGSCSSDDEPSSIKMQNDTLHDFFNFSRRQSDDQGCIRLIMGQKASDLSELPLEKSDFSRLVQDLKIHASLLRVINRKTSCCFSAMSFGWDCQGMDYTRNSIVYSCRTSGSWSDDMVLSVTFFPKTLTTHAVWFGLDLSTHDIHGFQATDAQVITSRLSNFDGELLHPMLLPTIFADFERERHAKLVRESTTEIVQRLCDLAYQDEPQRPNENLQQIKLSALNFNRKSISMAVGHLWELIRKVWTPSREEIPQTGEKGESSIDSSTSPITQDPSVIMWINLSHLRNGLENWKAKLLKMVEHIDDLNGEELWTGFSPSTSEWNGKRDAFKQCGLRIKRRLLDLMHEYDEFTRECTQSMEGMSLANQLELNMISQKDAKTNGDISRVNLRVAKMTRRDGNLMKFIAVLGMIFLPATFIASFFSMDFFQWTEGSDGDTVSPYIWLYPVVTLCLTSLTLGAFFTYNRLWGNTESKDVEE